MTTTQEPVLDGGKDAMQKFEDDKLEQDKSDIIAALDYRSGPDSCNSVYLGSMATAMICHAVGITYGDSADRREAIRNATREQIDKALEVCCGVIACMEALPTSTCPTCGTKGASLSTAVREDETVAVKPLNRVWFDTEFIEDGKTIELVSIGLIREDGATYYAEVAGVDMTRADPWLHQNVFPHLQGGDALKTRAQIATDVIAFAGEKPEFWAYYADYDWVVLCQLFGRMIDLPKGWPMFCRDLKQEAGIQKLPAQTGVEHHALADAIWTKKAFESLGAGLPLYTRPASPAPATPPTPSGAVEALILMVDAFLSRNEGSFPMDEVTEEQRLWKYAMKAAYAAIGQPRTREREEKLAALQSQPIAPAGEGVVTEAMVDAATRQIILAMQLRDFGNVSENGDFTCSVQQIDLLEQQARIAARAALTDALSTPLSPNTVDDSQGPDPVAKVGDATISPAPSGAVEALDIDALLQPIEDIYAVQVRDGFCDWADVADARDEIRRSLSAQEGRKNG